MLSRPVSSGGNLTNRIVWALLIEVIVFVVTIILAMVDTSVWPGTFCYLTIASIVILNGKYQYFKLNFFRIIFLSLSYKEPTIVLSISFFNSCKWNLSKYRLWTGSEVAIQLYWCCDSRLGK